MNLINVSIEVANAYMPHNFLNYLEKLFRIPQNHVSSGVYFVRKTMLHAAENNRAHVANTMHLIFRLTVVHKTNITRTRICQ